ncbi:MAG TPA: class IV adenylate cyclase [Patescibacteria group bacterium]|jgi:adenylate cyclase class 2|nr:class IV adenylate cyclase [Patescibacteria group bacterium]
MQTEIEVKFLDVNHDQIRNRLSSLGATCKQPMRLMRRAILDYADRRLQHGESNSFVRVRDEGDKITLTYKKFESLSVDGARELETTVGSFEATISILLAIGLEVSSLQESKRETWEYMGCTIELDEWPWLNPYLEIEGSSEESLKRIAKALGLDWSKAAFGDVMVAYRAQYPSLSGKETVGSLPEVKFDAPLPGFLNNAVKITPG